MTFYAKAIPSVLLYRILCAEVPIDFVSGRDLDPYDTFDDEPPGDALIERLIYRRYFEVRLGAVPITGSGRIGLVFNQLCLSELWNEHSRVAWQMANFKTIPPRWENVDTYRAFNGPPGVFDEDVAFDRFDAFQSWIRSDAETILPTTLSDLPRNYMYDHDDYQPGPQLVEQVAPWTCKKYLGLVVNDVIECFIAANPHSALECPAETIAGRIEAGLYSDEADRIDNLLKEEIERRCSLLDSCLERRRVRIDQNKRHGSLHRRSRSENQRRKSRTTRSPQATVCAAVSMPFRPR
jgi:hypothetical protein